MGGCGVSAANELLTYEIVFKKARGYRGIGLEITSFLWLCEK